MAGNRVIAVVGPTAAGKSDLGIALAREFGGEVVNADSMQLYRGLDIGTAKLTEAEREGVPHHLLDIWDVTERAAVAEYQRLARAAVDALLAADRVPVLVGGSGLYVDAVLGGFDFPGTDPAIRARLEARLADEGSAALHAELAALDPRSAVAILPSNGRRIVRALEVVLLTGAPFQSSLPEAGDHYPGTVRIGLGIEKAELDERITRRVDAMWDKGLVDEVVGLIPRGLREGETASRALGYQQVLDFLDGHCTEQEARDLTALKTRQFARRQEKWFRRAQDTVWLERNRGDLISAATKAVAAAA
ncbi:MAG TPA: tRNA (adenosine(37)-N6)-dimethylallyltransferase MiaA [Actinospica sp.]|nr:tRNA (adenosine(37)-N6)-dimethylallyltransferase MiaA [Actinospica sp.]HWG26879.1 tRNA (adenosine(37)-N6)-dimethylallyltransferase MiaA [Actinospica sp.]